MKPLGEYDEFSSWSGEARSWGPDAGWRAWFGGGVVEGLVTAIDEHIDAVRQGSQHGKPVPAAIGCVFRVTSQRVIDRLTALGACCVVVDKGMTQKDNLAPLVEADNGFPISDLPWLAEYAGRDHDAKPKLVGPEGIPTQFAGPVRVAGYRSDGYYMPLLHAKMLLLGTLRWGEDDFGSEIRFFSPTGLWFGSANWTESAAAHIETGFLVDDSRLVADAEDFLASVIAFSEPLESQQTEPSPELAAVEYDDEAFADYLAEYGSMEVEE